jgi:hypothetical protein
VYFDFKEAGKIVSKYSTEVRKEMIACINIIKDSIPADIYQKIMDVLNY